MEKIVLEKVPKSFVIQRFLWVVLLVVLAIFVFIDGKNLSEREKMDMAYQESDPSFGITIKETDKSAFETLTDKDIENQFNDIIDKLDINQLQYKIDTRNIGVKNPFLPWANAGNKYVDKDLQAKIEEEANKTNTNNQILNGNWNGENQIVNN